MFICVKFFTLISIIMLNENVRGKPQDIKDAAVLAFAQAKEIVDNGAAAGDKKEIEIFGAKIKNEMEIGFGDAARSKRSNQDQEAFMSLNSFENNLSRTKRFADIAGNIKNFKEKIITKRATDDNAIVADNSGDYDYSSSSSSSSSSSTSEEEEDSKENKRNKRSLFDVLMLADLYK